MTSDDEGRGGGGVKIPPKMMTSFMNSPLSLLIKYSNTKKFNDCRRSLDKVIAAQLLRRSHYCNYYRNYYGHTNDCLTVLVGHLVLKIISNLLRS